MTTLEFTNVQGSFKFPPPPPPIIYVVFDTFTDTNDVPIYNHTAEIGGIYSPVSNGNTLLIDNFSDIESTPLSSHWVTFSYNQQGYSITGTEPEIHSNHVVMDANDPALCWTTGWWTEGISVEATVTSPPSAHDEDWKFMIGLASAYTDQLNSYNGTFVLASGTRVDAIIQEGSTPLVTVSGCGEVWPDGVTKNIKLSYDGAILCLYLDDVLCASVVETPSQSNSSIFFGSSESISTGNIIIEYLVVERLETVKEILIENNTAQFIQNLPFIADIELLTVSAAGGTIECDVACIAADNINYDIPGVVFLFNGDTGCGIICALSSTGGGHGNSGIGLYRLENFTIMTGSSTNIPSTSIGQIYKLKIVYDAYGTDINVYLDDVLKLSHQDLSNITLGTSVGISSYQVRNQGESTVQWDNFKVV